MMLDHDTPTKDHLVFMSEFILQKNGNYKGKTVLGISWKKCEILQNLRFEHHD